MNRRNFLKLASLSPFIYPSLALSTAKTPRHLLLIELNGGNDSLNTVIPIKDPNYYKLRPNIAFSPDKTLYLSDDLALHPALKSFTTFWNDKELAIVNGLGYPDPNLSHFRSIEIWDTASTDHIEAYTGWLAPIAKHISNKHYLDALALKRNARSIQSEFTNAPLIDSLGSYLNKLHRESDLLSKTNNPALNHLLSVNNEVNDLSKYLSKLNLTLAKDNFPMTPIGKTLAEAAKIFVNRSLTPIVKISHGSFDTHINQPHKHGKLLKELAEGLDAFKNTMQEYDLWEDMLIMTYSEFGRRPKENGSKGTDHGTVASHFVIGGNIRGGIYGKMPTLENLGNSNPDYHVDFRSYYRTVAEDWFGVYGTLDKRFDKLGFIKS